MFEPQSPVLFVLLVVAFGALMWWMLITDRAALRILAACLAFTLAMLCGVMAVNKYYGYYQTWPAAIGDLTNQGANAAPQMPDRGLLSRSRLGTPDSTEIYRGLARRLGYTLRLKVAGQRSHITRAVYVYLPPQYFQPRYTSYRFPVIELIHGQPGEPQDWINVVGVTDTLDHLVNENLAHPIRQVNPFGGNHALERDNAPLDEVQEVPAGAALPRFWLGAGTASKLDVANAEFFRQELQLRQADVPLTLTPGGGHNMATWQAEVPRMLKWMAQGLASAASLH